jgi:4'-phosphopantetheinyl transferase
MPVSPSPHLIALPAASLSEVRLWYVDLDRYAAATALDGLASGELRSASRKVFARDRLRYQASRHALRQVLGSILGLPPAEVMIGVDTVDRPVLNHGGGLDFNLSHSDNACLIGVSRDRPIGVDIETLRAIDDADTLAAQHFARAERVELAGSSEPHGRAFLSCWTRKEACLKALGVGLYASLSAVETGCTPERRNVRLALGQDYCELTVESIEVPANAVAAIALTTQGAVALARRFFKRS